MCPCPCPLVMGGGGGGRRGEPGLGLKMGASPVPEIIKKITSYIVHRDSRCNVKTKASSKNPDQGVSDVPLWPTSARHLRKYE